MFKGYDAQKLLNDVKIIAKAVKITRDENNLENRKFAVGVVEDLLNRLCNDIEEMTDGFIQPKEYKGTGKIDGMNLLQKEKEL